MSSPADRAAARMGISRLAMPQGQEAAVICVFDDGSLAFLGAYSAKEASRRAGVWGESTGLQIIVVKLKQKCFVAPPETPLYEGSPLRKDSEAPSWTGPDVPEALGGAGLPLPRVERSTEGRPALPSGRPGESRVGQSSGFASGPVEAQKPGRNEKSAAAEVSARSGRGGAKRNSVQDTRGLSFSSPLPVARPPDDEAKARPSVKISRASDSSRTLSRFPLATGEEEEEAGEEREKEEKSPPGEEQEPRHKSRRDVPEDEQAFAALIASHFADLPPASSPGAGAAKKEEKPAASARVADEDRLGRVSELLVGVFNKLIEAGEDDESAAPDPEKFDPAAMRELRRLVASAGDDKARLAGAIDNLVAGIDDCDERAAAAARLNDILRSAER